MFLLDGTDDLAAPIFQQGDIVVHGKADLGRQADLAVSGKTGEGIDALTTLIASELQGRVPAAATFTRERHRTAAARAIAALESARFRIEGGGSHVELAAEDLRLAVRALDSIVGRVDTEDLLDEIFSSFCIGK